MKIKKGDNIIVLTGKDKGKKGVVLRAFPDRDRVVVEGINMKKKHQKARRSNEKGQTVELAFPMHVSNVKLASEKAKEKKAKKPTSKKA